MDSLTDLVYSINFQSDLGQLSNIEQATQNIDRNMNELSNNSRNANSSIRDVASSASNTDNNLRNASSSAREVAENTNEVDGNLRNTSESARDVDENIRQASRSTEQVNNATRTTDRNLRNTSRSARETDRNFRGAGRGARDVERNVQGADRETNNLNRSASNTEGTFKRVAKAIGSAFVVKKITDFTKAGFEAFAEFEQSMAKVKATIGDVSDNDFEKLKKAALSASETTAYSSKEAGEALQYEALAGFSVQESIEALPAILNVAAAGELDLGKASDLVTDSMGALGLTTKDLGTFTDQLARTAQRSNTDVDALGEALLVVAGTAKNAGLSVAETNTYIGQLANEGIKASQGGTALRNVLLNLTAPQDNVAKLLKEMGVHIADNTGKIKPLNTILMDLKSKLSGYSEAERQAILATIGGKENVQALNVLLKGSGKNYEELKKKILDSKGAAEEMAAIQNGTVMGALKQLKHRIQNVGIAMFQTKGNSQGLQRAIRKITACVPRAQQVLTSFAKGVGKTFSFIAKHRKIVVPAVMAIVGSFAAFKTVKKVIGIIDGFKSALTGIKATVTLLTSPVGLVVIGIAALAAGLIYAYKHSEKFRNQVQALWNHLKGIADFIMTYVVPVISGAFGSLVETAKAIWSNITEIIGGAIQVFNGVIDFITGVFTGNWSQAWEGIKGIFKGIWDEIKGMFKATINSMTAGINMLIGGINKINFKVPDWVPGVGGKQLSPHIPEIPRLAKGTQSWQGGMARINDEYGGEIVELQGGDKVYPHDQSIHKAREDGRKEASKTPTNVSLTININGTNDPKQVAREVKKQIESIFSTVNLQLGYGSL